MVAVENLSEYLLEQIKTHDVVRVPASEAEYLDIAPGFPGKIEYHNGEIIAMNLASFIHEMLVTSIGRILSNFYYDKDFLVSSSNAGLQIPRRDGGYYQPDLMVIQDQPIFKQGSNCIITNPYLLVEILSPATGKYDIEHKLEYYKELPGLNYIVYVAQSHPYLTVYERTAQPNVWLNTDCKTLDDTAISGDLRLPLREVYHKIQFPSSL